MDAKQLLNAMISNYVEIRARIEEEGAVNGYQAALVHAAMIANNSDAATAIEWVEVAIREGIAAQG
jgi:hypothetical protein